MDGVKESLLNSIKKKWGKKSSIPTTGVLDLILYVSLVAFLDSTTFRSFSFGVKQYIVGGFIMLMLWCFYIFFCVMNDRLPVAPRETLSVLFIVDTETDQLFDQIRFNLVENFQQIVPRCEHLPISSLCVQKRQIKRYDTSKKEDAIELLERTNCLFLVNVRYAVNDATNAEFYEMRIDYGVRHRQFEEQAEKIFRQDLCSLGESIGRRRFVRAQTLDEFNFTAQALSLICQYLTGFIFLLSGDSHSALDLLSRLNETLAANCPDITIINLLKKLVRERLFIVYLQLASNAQMNFEQDKGLHNLKLLDDALESANNIIPNTYFYNLNKAYLYIAKDGDAAKAKKCIGYCKKVKQLNDWKYSEAFLSAYCGYAPRSIIRNYERAFRYNCCNLIHIVDYIEFILNREPNKDSLHLAAGLVYSELGDTVLMKYHLSKYLEKNPSVDLPAITEKIAISCEPECNKPCIDCPRAL